jgi:glycosyltransferase involved in cell wall biosynthesis
MIVHLFNSSVVSGPEMLVLPALRNLEEPVTVIFLTERRLEKACKLPIRYAQGLGHTVLSVSVRGRWDTRAMAELRSVLDTLPVKVVHAHDVKASVYLLKAKQLRKGFKPALVSTHHGASYRKGLIRIYEEFYVRRILPHFDLICCVCEIDRKSIIRRGVPENKVVVHLNGTDRMPVNTAERGTKAHMIRKRWKERMPGLPEPDQAVFLGAVARLSPEKRHDRMLKALKDLSQSKGPAEKSVLLCFGLGQEEERLKAMAKQSGVSERVFWMGYSDTISQEMAGFDILLCLSDGEGIPISLLEAGWAGTPVFATAVGGIPELISTPQVGYLIQKTSSDAEVAFQLQNALSNPGELRSIGDAFQTRVVSQFSQKAWLSQLKKVYASL